MLGNHSMGQILTQMKTYNLHNKTFTLVQNSEHGATDSQTIFHYQQEGDLVTADYSGGSIRYGKIIARLENDHLQMLYQCMTNEGELKAGKASAKLSFNEPASPLGRSEKIKMQLDWEWLNDSKKKGRSEYLEQ